MCEQCNEALIVAAQAAKDLSAAASSLYHINHNAEAAVLAKAAAALFEEVKPAEDQPKPGEAEAQSDAESEFEYARRKLNKSLPMGVHVDKDGVFYIDGRAVGSAVLVSR